MIDLGDFQPSSALGPTRSSGGTTLGRLTTSEEQRQEAIERIVQAAGEHKENIVRARVIWSRGEPTILEVTCVIEHLNGKRVWLADRVLEMTEHGSEIPRDERARLRTLADEIEDLHERAML